MRLPWRRETEDGPEGQADDRAANAHDRTDEPTEIDHLLAHPWGPPALGQPPAGPQPLARPPRDEPGGPAGADDMEPAQIERLDAHETEAADPMELADVTALGAADERSTRGAGDQGGAIRGFQEPDPHTEPTTPSHAPLEADRETKRMIEELGQAHEGRSKRARAKATKRARKARELAEKAARESELDPERPVTAIPEITDPSIEEVEFFTIEQNRSYVRILFDERTNQYLYEVIEPQLTDAEQGALEFLRETLVRTMDGRKDPDEDWEGYLVEAVDGAIVDHSMLVDHVSKQRLHHRIRREFLGYGPIDVLMKDPMIEDISCDGPDIPIYVFHRRYESIKTNVLWENEPELDSFVIKLAQRSGKHISIAEPMLDATLPDTSRLQATLAREVTTRGSSFTIRKFRSDPLTAPDLIRLGTINARIAAYLWMAMEDGAPMLLAGGTASGKTTTLNAICQFIPPAKKIVSIEDTREIHLIHENWIAGLTRAGFTGAGKQGEGSIGMYQLLESALRQRPEYLLVGEVRGPEAQTLFQAMATGHATYSTLHGDSVMSAVYRLENPPIDIPRLMLQTLDCVAVQVQARVDDQLVRRLKELTEIVGIDSRTGDLLTNQVYRWDPRKDTFRYMGKSHVLERRMEKHNLTPEQVEAEWENRALLLDWMVDKGIRHIRDVSTVLTAYYARPEAVLDRVRGSMEPAAVEELLEAQDHELADPTGAEEPVGDEEVSPGGPG